MFSRRSSRASSVSSHNGDARRDKDDDIQIDDHQNGHVDENDPETSFGDDFQYTQEHPLGRILLQLAKDHVNLARKTNLKSMNTSIDKLCSDFKRGMLQERAESKQDIDDVTRQIELNIIHKELNSHKINAIIEPPTNFSPTPAIHSANKLKEIQGVFPKRGHFSGFPKDGGTSVTEFLRQLNEAQERCRLSEDEFIARMLASSTGLAHDLILEWRTNGESADTIYHNLLLNFDKRQNPEDARQQLSSYKISKNSSLGHAQSKIMLLAGRAADAYPQGESRITYYNMEAINALIRALPPNSSQQASNLYHSLTSRLGKACTYSNLVRSLNAFRTTIDRDIRQFGADSQRPRRPMNQRSFGNRPKISAYNISTGGTGSNTIKPFTSAQNTTARSSSFGSNNKNASYRFRPRPVNRIPLGGRGRAMGGNRRFGARANNLNRNYIAKCSLCGVPNHKPQECKNMRDDKGEILNVMPMLGTCSKCPKYIFPRLHHQEKICPYRPGGPLARKPSGQTKRKAN